MAEMLRHKDGLERRPGTGARPHPCPPRCEAEEEVRLAVTSRVDTFMARYAELSGAQQLMVRDMVELAYRRVMAERLEASVPYLISAGVR
jgi:hypothetical protein